MNLAYPQIQESLHELLGSDGPEIDFVGPEVLGIHNTSQNFGTVQQLFHLVYKVGAGKRRGVHMGAGSGAAFTFFLRPWALRGRRP